MFIIMATDHTVDLNKKISEVRNSGIQRVVVFPYLHALRNKTLFDSTTKIQ